MKFLTLTILLLSSVSFGQSLSEIENYLTANWLSTASVIMGDTTAMQYDDEKLFLQKDNEFTMIVSDKNFKGEWQYLPENDLLILKVKTMNGEDLGERMRMNTELEILQRKDNILTLSKNGGRTIIYIKEGTEIKLHSSQ